MWLNLVEDGLCGRDQSCLAFALSSFASARVTAVAGGRAAAGLVGRDFDGSEHLESKKGLCGCGRWFDISSCH